MHVWTSLLGCSSWGVISQRDESQSCHFFHSVRWKDGLRLCNTHTYTHTHWSTPVWWISITYRCPPLILQTEALIDCGHWKITIRKDARSELFFKPGDTKDGCWAVKFLHPNPSRCHPVILLFHPTRSANTSFFIRLKFFLTVRWVSGKGLELLELLCRE